MKFGDFTDLADAYSEARPQYSPYTRDYLLKEAEIIENSQILDVGAGTGIWTRMLREKTNCKILAVEPNISMFRAGVRDSQNYHIDWHNATAEDFHYKASNFDLITMASSFHWTNYDQAISNFKTALKPNGLFCALWNTRVFEFNSKLQIIEKYLSDHLSRPRVSSGKSEFTETLTSKLISSFELQNVVFLQSYHEEWMSVERYIRIWESVNDVRVQLGNKGFDRFIEFVKDVFKGDENLVATYETRAWIARNRG